MKEIKFTKEEITILLKLVCNETQLMVNRKKDITEMYELRYKLSRK